MDKPCKYCGHVAARQSDEDCPAKPRSVAPHSVKPRRAYDEENPQGYRESDTDYMENNRELVIALLDALSREQG